MAASSRAQVLRLYRALLRESQRFSGYNYRSPEASNESAMGAHVKAIHLCYQKGWSLAAPLLDPIYVLTVGEKDLFWRSTLEFHKRAQDTVSHRRLLSAYKEEWGAWTWRPQFWGVGTYAIRRIRDAFRENKSIKDSEKIEELLNKAKENLEIIHRQVTIGQMYATQKLVIESPGNT